MDKNQGGPTRLVGSVSRLRPHGLPRRPAPVVLGEGIRERTSPTRIAFGSIPALVVVAFWAASMATVPAAPVAAEEPPALNPFGAVQRDRDDAVPGYLELSDGTILVGNVYTTRDKRLKIEDKNLQRQREVPLSAVQQIECHVDKEWMEKEWRFKEAALNEKVFTGRTYPSREYSHTIALKNGKKLTGPLAEIFYIQPYAEMPQGPRSEDATPEPQRFLLNKRNKGPVGTDLKSLVYVVRIKLGQDAVEEGKAKAGKQGSASPRKKSSAPAKTPNSADAGPEPPAGDEEPSRSEPEEPPVKKRRSSKKN
jgi:hypothetical protein